MFKKTLNYSELKSDSSILTEMKDGDVYQVFHRGQDVKVMMTQEHFFNLMARLDKAEGLDTRVKHDPEEIMNMFDQKMKKLDDILGKVERKKDKAS